MPRADIKISKQMQLGLCITLVLSALVLLKPEYLPVPAEATRHLISRSTQPPVLAPSADMRHRTVALTAHTSAPWIRPPREAWQAPAESAPIAVPQLIASPPAPSLVAEPLNALAPDPGLSYLGRMVEDGRTYVFLGRAGNPLIVEAGTVLDDQWKIERITANQVELRYLPLNESRVIAVQ